MRYEWPPWNIQPRISETQMMRQEEPGLGGPLGPIELRKLVPLEPCAASDLLGCVGVEAARRVGSSRANVPDVVTPLHDAGTTAAGTTNRATTRRSTPTPPAP